jgi:hypothetical protein
VGFEPTIPVFERANEVHALDRASTVIVYFPRYPYIFSTGFNLPHKKNLSYGYQGVNYLSPSNNNFIAIK